MKTVCELLLSAMIDPDRSSLPAVGSIERWVSNVAILSSPVCGAALRSACQAWVGSG